MPNKPSFFIAGNSKSGTTALFEFLRQHPDIFMPDDKEPNFFATDLTRDPGNGSFRKRTESEYLALFEPAESHQVCGEASACYMYSQSAAQNIRQFAPDARLIFVLREPVSFLLSYHQQQLKNPITEGESISDFEQALALEQDRKRGKEIPSGCLLPELLFYRERVQYKTQLKRFTDIFPMDQLAIHLYEDFQVDNQKTVSDLYEFLDVDASFAPVLEQHNQRGRQIRSATAMRHLRALTEGTGWGRLPKALLKPLLPNALRKKAVAAAYNQVAYQEPNQNDELIHQLKEEFRPLVDDLSTFLDRDLLTIWNYQT